VNVNISNEGGPVLAFQDSWRAEDPDDPVTTPLLNGEWLAYCREREAQERTAAKNAHSIEARRVHQELAQGYARFVRAR
jgi:hypothetical protein